MHAQRIVKTSGAESLIEISNWSVGGSTCIDFSMCYNPLVSRVAAAAAAAAAMIL